MGPLKLKSAIMGVSFVLGSALMSSTAFAQSRLEIASFTGNENMAFPRANSLDLDEFGAIEFWVNPVWDEDKVENSALISYIGPEGSRYAVILTKDKSKIGLLSRDQWDWISVDFTKNKLRHVLINMFGEFADVFVDGEHAGVISSGTTDTFATRLHVGSYDGDNLIFTGDMTGIRIWDEPIDEDLISKHAAEDIFGKTSHPEIDSLVGGSVWVTEGEREGLSFKLTDQTDSVVQLEREIIEKLIENQNEETLNEAPLAVTE